MLYCCNAGKICRICRILMCQMQLHRQPCTVQVCLNISSPGLKTELIPVRSMTCHTSCSFCLSLNQLKCRHEYSQENQHLMLPMRALTRNGMCGRRRQQALPAPLQGSNLRSLENRNSRAVRDATQHKMVPAIDQHPSAPKLGDMPSTERLQQWRSARAVSVTGTDGKKYPNKAYRQYVTRDCKVNRTCIGCF